MLAVSGRGTQIRLSDSVCFAVCRHNIVQFPLNDCRCSLSGDALQELVVAKNSVVFVHAPGDGRVPVHDRATIHILTIPAERFASLRTEHREHPIGGQEIAISQAHAAQVAALRVLRQVRSDAGPQGIQMNIADQSERIGVGIDQYGAIAPLEEGAPAAKESIRLSCIARRRVMHQCCYGSMAGL